MPDVPLDELLANYLQKTGLVSFENIGDARKVQAESAKNGKPISLADALVRQGILTPTQCETMYQRIKAQQQPSLQKLGEYKLLSKLGEGGMGTVYLAEDIASKRKVALKVLHKKFINDGDFLTRFRREARAAGKLNHVNIVAAIDFGEDQGLHYYAMEYFEGQPLDTMLKARQYLPYRTALEMTMQVARGLKHAHASGLIHRDIKPANIYYTQDGIAKILDLGLSKNLAETDGSLNTQTGVALGTPHYISPEQARGEKSIDARADIYSLGATLYHLLTGQTPFAGSTGAMIMLKHLNDQLPNPQDIRDDIPDGTVHIIQKMMTKERDDRYRDCTELLADLQLAIDGQPPGSKAIEPSKSSVAMRLPRAARRKTLGVARPMPRRGTGSQEPVPGVSAPAAQSHKPKKSATFSKNSNRTMLAGLLASVLIMVLAIVWVAGRGSPQAQSPKTPDAPVTHLESTAVKPAAANPANPANSTVAGTETASRVEQSDPEMERLRSDRAARLLADARTYFKGHPENPWMYQDKLAALNSYRMTPAGAEAAALLGALVLPGPRPWRVGASLFQGHQFKVFREKITWAAAKLKCEDMSGHLAFALAPGRAALIAQLTRDNFQSTDLLCLGGTDEAVTGTWRWLNGDPIQYKLWDPAAVADPNGAPTDYLGMSVVKGVWSRIKADDPNIVGYVCEWDSLDATTQAALASLTPASNQAGSSEWLNLLPQVDPLKDSVAGGWSIQNGELACSATNDCRLQIPYVPPEEYDFRITFSPQSGVDSVGQYVSKIGKSFLYQMNGYHKNLYLFEGIDGKAGFSNASATQADDLQNGHKYTSLVEVRKGSVTAFLDGRLILRWITDYSDIAVLQSSLLLRDDRFLGLYTWQRPTLFHGIEVREVSGKGQFARAGPGVTAAPQPDNGNDRWVNLLPSIDPQRDSVRGTWALQDGKLALSESDIEATIQIPYRPSPEYDFRIVFTRVTGALNVKQIFPQSGTACAWMMDQDSHYSIENVNGNNFNPANTGSSARLENGREYTSLVEVRSGSIRTYLDDRLIAQWKQIDGLLSSNPGWLPRDPAALALGAYKSAVLFRSVEVREIGGRIAATRPDDSAPAAQTQAPTVSPAAAAAAQEAAIQLKYQKAVHDAFRMLRDEDGKGALERLQKARTDAALESMRPEIDLEIEFVQYAEDLKKAALAGAGLLKDGREFKLKKSDGKEVPTGKGSKNTVLDVKNNVINIELDLGAGKAGMRLTLQQLSPQTRYELAELGMPAGAAKAEGALKLALAKLILMQNGASEFNIDKIRKGLPDEENETPLRKRIEHFKSRLDYLEREKKAANALEDLTNLEKDKSWKEAAKALAEIKNAYGDSLFIAEFLPPLEKRLLASGALTPPRLPPDPAIDTPARWKNAIDLLALVDINTDGVVGKWDLLDNALVGTAPPGPGCRLQLPYQAPEEYDFRIGFTRRTGNSDVVQILANGRFAVGWVIGAGGNKIMGFDLVNGRRVMDNPTSVRVSSCIENGRRNVSIVQVRKNGLKAYLNGVLVAQIPIDGSNLSNSTWKLRDELSLGVATYGSTTEFSEIQVLEIGGKGKLTRGRK